MRTLTMLASLLICLMLPLGTMSAKSAMYEITRDTPVFRFTRVQVTITEMGSATLDSVCALNSSLVGPALDQNSDFSDVKTECCINATSNSLTLDFSITSTEEIVVPTGSNTPVGPLGFACGMVERDSTTGTYQLSVRTYSTVNTTSSTDMVFIMTFGIFMNSTGTVSAEDSFSFTSVVPPERIMDITQEAAGILRFVQPDGTEVISPVPLGLTVCLEAELIIDPYMAGVDYAGFRVTNCFFTRTTSLDGATPFLLGNGCTDNRFSPILAEGVGFTKFSHSVDGNRLIYRARLPCFPAYTLVYSYVAFVTCSVEYCLDASDTLALGSCGGNHCDPTAIKKRSASVPFYGNSSLLLASVPTTITTNSDNVRPCSESFVFKSTIGGLGSAAVTLFVAILVCFVDMRRTRKQEVKGRARQQEDTRSMSTRSSFIYPDSVSLGYNTTC